MVKQFLVPDNVPTALKGFVKTNPAVALLESHKVVYKKACPAAGTKCVAVISGGGSGHEPTHAGFVGHNMLDAAVCGNIFASPSTKQIFAAIETVSHPDSGTLLVVKNYTGDVLNFGLAGERANGAGFHVDAVIVGDDVAVGRKKGGLVGRRGIAGTVLVHKAAGTAAEHGLPLADVKKTAQAVADNLVSIGSSLEHCAIPGRPFESDLAENQMEVGMGIHNEAGVYKLAPIPSTEKLLAEHMLPMLLSESDEDRYFVPFKESDEVFLLVNNLGGLSQLDMLGIGELVVAQLEKTYKISPKVTVIGTYMTALNGPGFSVTLLNASRASEQLKKAGLDLDVLELLKESSDAPAWVNVAPVIETEALTGGAGVAKDQVTAPAGKFSFEALSSLLESGASALKEAEPTVTRYDTVVGDGDCGTTLLAGATAIINALAAKEIPSDSLSAAVAKIADLVEDSMGGTSGGLYSIFLSGLVKGLQSEVQQEEVTVANLSKALKVAQDTLYKYTRARVGDRTVIDALEPFITELSTSGDVAAAVAAAEKGSESTKELGAKFGRSSYVSEHQFGTDDDKIPDPGAYGLVAFLKGALL